MTDNPAEDESPLIGDPETDEPDDDPGYRNPSEIDGMDLYHALQSLTLFRDTYLGMQAFNLAIVDNFLMSLELRVLQRLVREQRTPIDDAMFLNAQSQMWIFAAYEVMRTWRQRASEIIKWHSTGGLQQKLRALETKREYRHPGLEARAGMLRQVLEHPTLIADLQDDLRRVHIPFRRMEYLRVSLAKHEVSGKAKMPAIAPGYGRINMRCGALDYELNNGRYIIDYLNRRDLADSLRAIPDLPVPDDEHIASFEAFMKGPSS